MRWIFRGANRIISHRHWKLGKIIALYDANNITIDGEINVSFTEDVLKRFEAYGWHVSTVEDGNNDLQAIEKAIHEAKAVTDKPSLIKISTTIGKVTSRSEHMLCSA